MSLCVGGIYVLLPGMFECVVCVWLYMYVYEFVCSFLVCEYVEVKVLGGGGRVWGPLWGTRSQLAAFSPLPLPLLPSQSSFPGLSAPKLTCFSGGSNSLFDTLVHLTSGQEGYLFTTSSLPGHMGRGSACGLGREHQAKPHFQAWTSDPPAGAPL